MKNAFRIGYSVIVGLAVLACGAGAPEDPPVEVVDSAGVTILTNTSEDIPLHWQFEPRLVLGGADDGPESFYQVHSDGIGVDAAGNLYILDGGNHEVLVFDAEGEFVRRIGQEGGGPGEFQGPNSLVVWPDGSFAVADLGKRGLVRFSVGDEPLDEEPLENWYGSPVSQVNGTIVVPSSRREDDGTMYDLLVAIEGDGREILSLRRQRGREVDYGCMRVDDVPPVFVPSLVWATGPRFIAAATGAEYVIDVYEGTGKTASIRRTVDLREATRALAVQQVGGSDGLGGCGIPAERVVEQRGYADAIPAIGRIAVAPDGTLWVERREVGEGPRAIDIFAAGGEYVGTLPPGTPFPAAFMPDGAVVVVEHDDFDLPHVVVYELMDEADPVTQR